MRIKVFHLFAFLLAFNALSANNIPSTISAPEFSNSEDGGCDLLPPANFHVVDIGATWIKYAWNTPVTPRAHRIRTYRSSDNTLLVTTNVSAGVDEATVVGLPTGTQVYSIINAVCSNGNNGSDSPSYTSTTLILDLVTNGYNAAYTDPTCYITEAGQSCPFYLNGVSNTFKFRQKVFPYVGRQFGVIETANHHLQVSVESTGNNNQTYIFAMDGISNLPRLNGAEFEIKLSEGSDLVKFHLTRNGYLVIFPTDYGGYIHPDYEIVRLTAGPEYAPPTTPQKTVLRDQGENKDYLATVSPNPFNDQLDVFLAPTTENIHLQLFNLSGQKVLDQQFTGGQEQYSLSTANLVTGFYLLRIEADGDVQTLKVIKSE